MISTRIIRRRIRSIQNTRKITRAMEMVSAAKMRKAVASVLATRSYSNLAWETVLHLVGKVEKIYHPLLEHRPVKSIALILISSNRGLCGGFNTNIANLALVEIKKEEKGAEIDLITLGKRGGDFIVRGGISVIADFEKPDLVTSITEISALSHLVLEDFMAKKYDKVLLAYTDFISSLRQKPRIKLLLPLEAARDEYLGEVYSPGESLNHKSRTVNYKYEHIFEPSAGEVLRDLLPRLIEMQIYQAVLESDASEHSARMMAMRNATEAAGEMIDDLTLTYNQARQASITKEMAEISTARVAME